MGTDDPLLTVSEVAALIGWRPDSWRSEVNRGKAPPADDPDEGRPASRRMPRWRRSTVEAWRKTRPGQGARTDLKREGT